MHEQSTKYRINTNRRHGLQNSAFGIILILLFFSCSNSEFTFSEEKQVFENCSHLIITDNCSGYNKNTTLFLEEKPKAIIIARKSINLNQIPNGYFLTNGSGDIILPCDFKLKENCEYEITNLVADRPSTTIIVSTDENGRLHFVGYAEW